MNILCLELEKLRPRRVRNDYEAGYDQAITQAQLVIEECAAIADRNPTGGDVKQAPSRSDESSGGEANRTDNPAITPCNQTTP